MDNLWRHLLKKKKKWRKQEQSEESFEAVADNGEDHIAQF